MVVRLSERNLPRGRIEPPLFYRSTNLLGKPETLVVVWKKLADQFEKTRATQLDLRCKLHSIRSKNG